MVQAYILVTVAVGEVKHVVKELERIPDVKSVHVVMGTYSIIVFAEIGSLARLTNVVVEGIHKIKGVVDTNTAVVVESK